MRSTGLPHQAIVTADEPITHRGDNTTTILGKPLSQQLLPPGHTACSSPRLPRPIKRKLQRTGKRKNRPSRQDQRPPGTKRVPKREGNTPQNQVRQRGRLHLHLRRVARVFSLPSVQQMRCAARLASGGRTRGGDRTQKQARTPPTGPPRTSSQQNPPAPEGGSGSPG